MRTQTLRRTSNHNRNCTSRPTFQDIGTRLFGDAADTHGEEDIAVEGHLEVGCEGEEVRFEAREGFGEPGGFCAEGG